MNVGRSYGNVVQLPDGSLVAVGGGAGKRSDGTDVNFTGGDERLKQVELLRPGIDTRVDARPAAAQVARVPLDRAAAARRPRAVDGRRLLAPRHAGAPAGRQSDGRGRDLLAAVPVRRRPARAAAADRGRAGRGALRRAVRRSGCATPRARCSWRPGATTHGADMNQRLVVLETLRTRDGVGRRRALAGRSGRRAAGLLHAVRARQRRARRRSRAGCASAPTRPAAGRRCPDPDADAAPTPPTPPPAADRRRPAAAVPTRARPPSGRKLRAAGLGHPAARPHGAARDRRRCERGAAAALEACSAEALRGRGRARARRSRVRPRARSSAARA